MSSAGRLVRVLAVVALVAGCGSPPERPDPAVEIPRARMQQGTEAFEADRYRLALTRFGDALEHYRSIDHRDGERRALLNLAETALVLGEHERAAARLEAAATLQPPEASSQMAGRLDLARARVAAARGETERARRISEDLREHPSSRVRRSALLLRAKLALDSGEEAATWIERAAAALPAENAHPLYRARLLRLQARAASSAAEKRDRLEEALALYRKDYHRPGLAAVHAELAALEEASGDWQGAWRHLQRALYIRLWMKDRVHSAPLIARLADVADERGETELADNLRDIRRSLQRDDVKWRELRRFWNRL